MDSVSVVVRGDCAGSSVETTICNLVERSTKAPEVQEETGREQGTFGSRVITGAAGLN